MKDKWIQAKEKWAKKMAGQAKHEVRSKDRLPPGQHLADGFPVLDLGIKPKVNLSEWTLSLTGQLESPTTLTWDQFLGLPQFEDVSDFHCVTTWSQFDMRWAGVSFFTLYELAQPKPDVTHVFLKSYDGYSTCVPLDACMEEDVLVAHQWNGEPLTVEHGGPARLVIPKLYAWKSAKFLREITFVDQNIKGYWELRGYSDTADPWTEDRFS